MNTETRATVQKIKISEVINMLKQGYTRFAADDLGYGSLETYFNLSQAAIRRMFQHEKLKGLKTTVPEFELIDDEDGTLEGEDMGDNYAESIREELKDISAAAKEQSIKVENPTETKVVNVFE